MAKLDGEPIVRRVVEAALASRADPVIVVVGHARGAVEAAVADLPAIIAFNSAFETGIASSLRTGLAATPPDADGAVVLLGDMPNVAPSLIDGLIGAFRARPTLLAVAPFQEGRRGNPVLLARSLFEQATRLAGDEGARRLLAALDRGAVAEIATASDVSFDVDTPDDLAKTQPREKKN